MDAGRKEAFNGIDHDRDAEREDVHVSVSVNDDDFVVAYVNVVVVDRLFAGR